MSRTVQEEIAAGATMKSLAEIRHTPLDQLTPDRINAVVRKIVDRRVDSRVVRVAAFGSAI